MIVSISSRMGNYDLLHTSKRECMVGIRTPYGNVSATFDEDVGDLSDQSVEDILDLIEHRIRGYWIYTRREEHLATIAAIREHLPECELALAESQLAAAERRFEAAKKAVDLKRETVAMLRKDMEEPA